jgi:hypothetical protein
MISSTRYSAIDSTGQSVLSRDERRKSLSIQNVGTVALTVFFNTDGTGDPVAIVAAGASNDDGIGGQLSDEWDGAVWVKAPTGTGRALVGTR